MPAVIRVNHLRVDGVVSAIKCNSQVHARNPMRVRVWSERLPPFFQAIDAQFAAQVEAEHEERATIRKRRNQKNKKPKKIRKIREGNPKRTTIVLLASPNSLR